MRISSYKQAALSKVQIINLSIKGCEQQKQPSKDTCFFPILTSSIQEITSVIPAQPGLHDLFPQLSCTEIHNRKNTQLFITTTTSTVKLK